MEIKQLRYFYTIAEEGHISRAAKRLFITQSGLSTQLKLIEGELGIKLVKRSNRGIILTDAGRLLQKRAGQILDLVNNTVMEVRKLGEG